MAYFLTSFSIDFYMGLRKSKINPSQLNVKPDICDFVADSMHSISLNDVNSKVYTARPTESLCLMIIDMMHLRSFTRNYQFGVLEKLSKFFPQENGVMLSVNLFFATGLGSKISFTA